jgi:hypothetical protein
MSTASGSENKASSLERILDALVSNHPHQGDDLLDSL